MNGLGRAEAPRTFEYCGPETLPPGPISTEFARRQAQIFHTMLVPPVGHLVLALCDELDTIRASAAKSASPSVSAAGRRADLAAARRLSSAASNVEAFEIARTIGVLCDEVEDLRRWQIHASAELERLGAVFP